MLGVILNVAPNVSVFVIMLLWSASVATYLFRTQKSDRANMLLQAMDNDKAQDTLIVRIMKYSVIGFIFVKFFQLCGLMMSDDIPWGVDIGVSVRWLVLDLNMPGGIFTGFFWLTVAMYTILGLLPLIRHVREKQLNTTFPVQDAEFYFRDIMLGALFIPASNLFFGMLSCSKIDQEKDWHIKKADTECWGGIHIFFGLVAFMSLFVLFPTAAKKSVSTNSKLKSFQIIPKYKLTVLFAEFFMAGVKALIGPFSSLASVTILTITVMSLAVWTFRLQPCLASGRFINHIRVAVYTGSSVLGLLAFTTIMINDGKNPVTIICMFVLMPPIMWFSYKRSGIFMEALDEKTFNNIMAALLDSAERDPAHHIKKLLEMSLAVQNHERIINMALVPLVNIVSNPDTTKAVVLDCFTIIANLCAYSESRQKLLESDDGYRIVGLLWAKVSPISNDVEAGLKMARSRSKMNLSLDADDAATPLPDSLGPMSPMDDGETKSEANDTPLPKVPVEFKDGDDTEKGDDVDSGGITAGNGGAEDTKIETVELDKVKSKEASPNKGKSPTPAGASSNKNKTVSKKESKKDTKKDSKKKSDAKKKTTKKKGGDKTADKYKTTTEAQGEEEKEDVAVVLDEVSADIETAILTALGNIYNILEQGKSAHAADDVMLMLKTEALDNYCFQQLFFLCLRDSKQTQEASVRLLTSLFFSYKDDELAFSRALALINNTTVLFPLLKSSDTGVRVGALKLVQHCMDDTLHPLEQVKELCYMFHYTTLLTDEHLIPKLINSPHSEEQSLAQKIKATMEKYPPPPKFTEDPAVTRYIPKNPEGKEDELECNGNPAVNVAVTLNQDGIIYLLAVRQPKAPSPSPVPEDASSPAPDGKSGDSSLANTANAELPPLNFPEKSGMLPSLDLSTVQGGGLPKLSPLPKVTPLLRQNSKTFGKEELPPLDAKKKKPKLTVNVPITPKNKKSTTATESNGSLPAKQLAALVTGDDDEKTESPTKSQLPGALTPDNDGGYETGAESGFESDGDGLLESKDGVLVRDWTQVEITPELVMLETTEGDGPYWIRAQKPCVANEQVVFVVEDLAPEFEYTFYLVGKRNDTGVIQDVQVSYTTPGLFLKLMKSNVIPKIKKIKSNDLTIIRTYKHPPVKVMQTLEAVISVIFGLTSKKAKELEWATIKKILADSQFVEDLVQFDSFRMNFKVIRFVKKEFFAGDENPVKKAYHTSPLIGLLMEWCYCHVNYGDRLNKMRKKWGEDVVHKYFEPKVKNVMRVSAKARFIKKMKMVMKINTGFRNRDSKEENEKKRAETEGAITARSARILARKSSSNVAALAAPPSARGKRAGSVTTPRDKSNTAKATTPKSGRQSATTPRNRPPVTPKSGRANRASTGLKGLGPGLSALKEAPEESKVTKKPSNKK